MAVVSSTDLDIIRDNYNYFRDELRRDRDAMHITLAWFTDRINTIRNEEQSIQRDNDNIFRIHGRVFDIRLQNHLLALYEQLANRADAPISAEDMDILRQNHPHIRSVMVRERNVCRIDFIWFNNMVNSLRREGAPSGRETSNIPTF